jgi:DNA primase
MIKQDKIIEVRDRASIVEIISDFVTLKKTGRNYMGLCPFHGEKTPSFTVNEEKGIFHCFGCRAGGSVFQFLMQYDHLTFPEAVERVAKRYGIAVERTEGAGGSDRAGERESLYHINERAASNYQRVLMDHPEGKKALNYLKSRGVDLDTARNFMLGYAPPSGSGLVDLMKKEKITSQDGLRLGLIGQRGPEQFHEKFFSRLMFPIINPAGKIVGFGGRVLDQGLPKYLNSSETPLFRKGSTLYGLYQAKDGIRKADRVVVVEGYLDAIALYQGGVNYAVATLGTALTADHVRLLARYTRNITALFDGDDAGRNAAARSFEIFSEAGLFGQAAFLPNGEDPDTFIRSRGKAALEAILERATPLADYYFSWLEQRHGKTLDGKSQIAGEVSRVLVKVNNPFEIDLLVRRAVDVLGIREELLRRPAAPRGGNPAATSPAAGAVPKAAAGRDDYTARSLIGLMLRYAPVVKEVAEQRDIREWIGPRWRAVVDLIISEWHKEGIVDIFRVAQSAPPEDASELAALELEGDALDEAEASRMAADCVAHLRRKHLRELGRDLRIAIRAAEERKDEKAKRERMLEWQDVVRQERQLERRRLESKTNIR